jgi:Putative SAM-dependent methyltransferase
MSYYQTVEPIIRRYEKLARNKFGKKFAKLVNEQFADLNKNYFSPVNNPNYAESLKKFAYLYKYSVAHGYFIFSALCTVKHPRLGWFLGTDTLRIACIGGGPGSEIMGIVRYLKRRNLDVENKTVIITIYDKEPTWKQLCSALLKEIDHNCQIFLKFVEMDATEKESYSGHDYSKYDLIISSFFMSETKKIGIAAKSKAYWRYVFGSMKNGSAIVLLDYADNDGKNWAYAEGLVAEFDHFEALSSEASVSMSCPDDKACLLDLETELDHRPKKNGTNFLKVATVSRI